jgi:hypothetical protein
MTSVELAQAALSSEPLARALELAAWIGAGREITGTGVLRPAAAVEACGVLGITPPSRKPRSAKDVEELQQAWDIAVAGEFIMTAGNRVRAASDARVLLRAAQGSAPLPDELAERTLLAWVRGAGVPMGIPGAPCPLCLTVLHELSLATSPVETGDLVAAVREAAGGNVVSAAVGEGAPDPDEGSYVCQDCGQVHEMPPDLTGPGSLLARAGEYADLMAEDAAEHTETAAGLLVYFDAAFTGPGRTPGGTVTLTPLGKMFAGSVFSSLAPPGDASAAEMVASLAELPPNVAVTLSARWSGARTPVAATSELLEYAEQAEPGLRFAALHLAREQGPPGTPAWRELAARPGFGAYARQWLSCLGERVAADDRDEAWLLADAMIQVSGEAPPGVLPFVLATAVWQMAGDDGSAVIDGLRESGHPAGPEIADAVGRFLSMTGAGQGKTGPEAIGPGGFGPDGFGSAGFGSAGFGPGGFGWDVSAPDVFGPGGSGPGDLADDDDFDDFGCDLPEGTALQLKITLRGVSKPAVWRRVLVPAEMTLGGLHQVIVRAMGWNGGHLHSFSDGLTEWGAADADSDLDIEDEDEVGVGFVLSVPGERLGYLYDFGDGWEHDVKLEKVFPPAGPRTPAPACLAGKGACPPDDCGGSGGYANLKVALADPGHEDHERLLKWLGVAGPGEFDPAQFSLAEVNERLRRAGIAAV